MNYQETLEYLYSRLPMFSTLGQAAIKPGLKNIIKFCEQLGNPQTKFRSIHVGGTNGKGSTSHMLAAILQTAGYKTGLYTSPHLRDFRERIRINGQMISENSVTDFIDQHRDQIEQIHPSFFETTVGMAFDHFAQHQVDVAVIEVGLGGRLDSTNIIEPALSIITNIGLDHVDILGKTIKEIASEKAGIIKRGVPVVIGEKQQKSEQVFLNTAADNNSPITFASDEWEVKDTRAEVQIHPGKLTISASRLHSAPLAKAVPIDSSLHVDLDLTGIYQLKNLATVLSGVDQLNNQGFLITQEHLQVALKQVTPLTGLMGRWQTISTAPLVICDTGHNEDGIREVIRNIAASDYQTLHMVIGMVKDKDITKILHLLPGDAIYYFCEPHIPRARAAAELAEEARNLGLYGDVYNSVMEAFLAAKKNAGRNDMVFVGGSTFVVAEVI
jgi:dihydrofolate synthase/folylpolyglutamate synthase